MKNKIYKISLLSCFVFALAFLHKAEAAVPVAVPFGGPILISYECSCSGGWLVLTYDNATQFPTPLVFQFGESMLRANYNIFTPSVQTLGSYTPGGICLMASLDCAGVTVDGTISPFGLPGIGTSLY